MATGCDKIPLSPMIFILPMDPLQRLLDAATQAPLSPIGAEPIRLRMRLHADDAVLFLLPTTTDVQNLQGLVDHFGKATGLCTNIQKSEIVPISYHDIDLREVLGDFQGAIATLPCKYLGLPLSLGKLCRKDEQKLIEKMAAKLPRWKGKLLNKIGRLTVVNSVLSSAVIYHMIVFSLSHDHDIDHGFSRFFHPYHCHLSLSARLNRSRSKMLMPPSFLGRCTHLLLMRQSPCCLSSDPFSRKFRLILSIRLIAIQKVEAMVDRNDFGAELRHPASNTEVHLHDLEYLEGTLSPCLRQPGIERRTTSFTD
jgi:hypothetical protein